MQLSPLKTSEFREQHAAALKHFKAVVADPGDNLLEQVRKIAADMDSDFNRWTPDATEF
jgi:hypothetical protein